MIRKALITGLYTGYLPVAPGTWGSAAVMIIYLVVAMATGSNNVVVSSAMGGIAVAATLGCLLLGGWAEREFGKKDPGRCTLDEWAGQAVSYIWLPISRDPFDLLAAALAGFVLFRLFDIVKPPPARKLQDLRGGLGIVIDDLIAGVYANLVAQLLLRVMGK